MDENRYVFDKRVVKAHFKRYGLIMLCCLPVLVAINVLIGDRLRSFTVILIDVVVALAIIFIIDSVSNYLEAKKQSKQDINHKLQNKKDNDKN